MRRIDRCVHEMLYTLDVRAAMKKAVKPTNGMFLQLLQQCDRAHKHIQCVRIFREPNALPARRPS